MKHNIITIGREFGSGGHEVGARLAERLGMKFYDKEFIKIAAEKMGCCENFVENNNEKTPSIFARSVAFSRGATTYAQLSPEDNIYVCQSLAVRELAEEGNCVIVGRCADYVLGECSNVVEVVSVFIRADLEKRVARGMRNYDLSESEARKLILKTDKIRSRYYESHTGRQWGGVGNYRLIVDTGEFGTDGAAALIETAIRQLMEKDEIIL